MQTATNVRVKATFKRIKKIITTKTVTRIGWSFCIETTSREQLLHFGLIFDAWHFPRVDRLEEVLQWSGRFQTMSGTTLKDKLLVFILQPNNKYLLFAIIKESNNKRNTLCDLPLTFIFTQEYNFVWFFPVGWRRLRVRILASYAAKVRVQLKHLQWWKGDYV